MLHSTQMKSPFPSTTLLHNDISSVQKNGIDIHLYKPDMTFQNPNDMFAI